MKVLWLCNIIPPVIAKELNLEASNKEGWISGLCDSLLKNGRDNRISLFIASPMKAGFFRAGKNFFQKEIPVPGGMLTFFGFSEDLDHPEKYDPSLESTLKSILVACQPDIVHCFGTEYPHTLAMCKVFMDKSRLLIHIQGVCTAIANAYFANLPEEITRSATLRDIIKKDSLRLQQQKFFLRGENENAALKLTENVCGRTGMDQYYVRKQNPHVHYFKLNETLRPEFYQGLWQADRCVPHSIFLSQGDYPIKGLHYMLQAMPAILAEFPDTKLYIAGNSIVNFHTLRQKLKISAYGRYLLKLIRENHLTDKVCFLGKLTAGEMKAQYLRSHLYVCCSSVENSPNSLGEAMLLGMPCIAADVGGIPDFFAAEGLRTNIHTSQNETAGDFSGQGSLAQNGTIGIAGIMYKGFECPENEYGYTGTLSGTEEEKMIKIAGNLSDSVLDIWKNDRKLSEFCETARELAMKNHDREQNYKDLIQIYDEIVNKNLK